MIGGFLYKQCKDSLIPLMVDVPIDDKVNPYEKMIEVLEKSETS